MPPPPPKGWELYLPNESFTPDHHLVPIIGGLVSWFRGNGRRLLRTVACGCRATASVVFDYQELLQCPVDGLAWAISERPQEAIPCLGIAVFEALFVNKARSGQAEFSQAAPIPVPERKVEVRFANYEPVTPMKYLKSQCIGKFVSVKGTVIRVSTIKPVLIEMKFLCTKCGFETLQRMTEGKFESPTCCSQCKGKSLLPDRSAAVTTDWQKVRLQEIITDESREDGRMPRTIECELIDDLVDKCIPGDEVTVSGIVKVMSSEGEGGARGQKSKCLFLLYIDANSIHNFKAHSSDKSDLSLTQKDLLAINEIAHEPDVFRLIVNSICPSIYGNEVVKMALALALFGGNQKHGEDKNKLSVRGDPHVLIVGEPGLGKSQMLQAVSLLAPRGVYVCGNTTSTAGLTVTVVKDAGTGDFALEAGALVLGDQGVCCIDEFDKMGGEQQALLEAMEQQSVSVAKAGIVCSLSARCSVIAAANPVGGQYNRAKTISENIKMSHAVMSRFDVIFILLDRPDQDRDHMLSEHVIALHRGAKQDQPSQRSGIHVGRHEGNQHARTLAQRLQLTAGQAWDPLPPVVMRKYIAYARKYCHPVLDDGAKQVIQDFYLQLRKRKNFMDSTPVTTRQLEALIRLAEARARLELREVITTEMALDVINLMRESMLDTLTDEFGTIDFGRTGGASKKGEFDKLRKALHRQAEAQGKSIFHIDEIRQVASGLGISCVDRVVESLNANQVLLMKGNRRYQLTSID